MTKMFSSVQIKHELIGVEEINRHARNEMPTNSKFQLLRDQEVEYKFRQLPQFWDDSSLHDDGSTKNDIHNCGVTFESRVQINSDTQDLRNVVQETTTVRSPASSKQSRPGRPPKTSVDSSTGKKTRCRCEICFKEFGHKSNLFIHMRTHNGERPYKCGQCEKCFTHSGNLAIHMRTHSGEKPYGCQICGKTFSHSGNLSTHLRTHSGVKPYKCSVCSKEFRHSGNLSIHERIHSGIKPFRCKVCGKDFYHSGNLSTHTKKHSAIANANTNLHQNMNQNVNDISVVNSTNSSHVTLPTLYVTSDVSVKNEKVNETMTSGVVVSMPTNC